MNTIKHLAITVAMGALPAVAFAGSEEEIESIDVAIRDASTGARVYVRADDDGQVEHNFYTPSDGYSGWSLVPDPNEAPCLGDIESVEAFAFRDGSLLYVVATEGGDIQQNIYTTAGGWTGWNDLPHPEDDKPEAPTLGSRSDLSSIDVEIMGSSLSSPRIFIRGFEDGTFEQCIYTPTDGFAAWSEIPAMQSLLDIADNIGADVESVQVTPMGGLLDPRIFVAGFNDPPRMYQNIYTPGDGFNGWKRVPNQTEQAAAGGGVNEIVSIDVQYLGNGVVLYVRGRENGVVQQNFYTPQDGFLGWNRVTRTDNPQGDEMESTAVELLTPGLFGARIYVRCFDADSRSEQCFYHPETGTTRWEEIP